MYSWVLLARPPNILARGEITAAQDDNGQVLEGQLDPLAPSPYWPELPFVATHLRIEQRFQRVTIDESTRVENTTFTFAAALADGRPIKAEFADGVAQTNDTVVAGLHKPALQPS